MDNLVYLDHLLIVTSVSFSYIYFVASSLVGALLVIVFFTFPETAYNRSPVDIAGGRDASAQLNELSGTDLEKDYKDIHVEAAVRNDSEVSNHGNADAPQKNSLVQRLAVFHGTFVLESTWRIFYRPVVLLCLPSVLWATLCMSVTIGKKQNKKRTNTEQSC